MLTKAAKCYYLLRSNYAKDDNPHSLSDINGGVAERSNATDCKSVDFSLRWFESIPLHH